MKKSILAIGFVLLVTLLSSFTTYASQSGVLITGNTYDETVIPDKYNTGCTGELTKVDFNQEVNGILIVGASNNTRFVMNFYYMNKDISGTVYVDNYDFSDHSLWFYDDVKVERNVHIIFRNCKFSSVNTGKAAGNVKVSFENCTINGLYGGNATLNYCQLGKSYSDCLVPYQDVTVNNCFFSDMSSMAATGGELHSDGTQIYGIKDIDVSNVHFNNCRFEIPPLRPEGSTAYVNACIMLQLEYSNANNLSFRNCITNGGGYSIYARSKYDTFTMDNVIFENICYGNAKRFSAVYSDIHPNAEFKNITKTNSLYIASVWKENGNTHLSVTNDTAEERTLVVYTDKGSYTFTIPACPSGSDMTSDMTYADMPFDLDIVIEEDCQYVVCYDNTLEGYAKQIRFVNWSGQDVYLEQDIIDSLMSGQDDILLSGSCGTNITFTLTKEGVLTLSGTGNTFNFHSTKFPEWTDYCGYIKEIRVEEGIEGLGSMIFKSCDNVKKITLPNSLKTIGQRAFAGCISFESFTIPANVTKIDAYAFLNVLLKEIYYTGENWDNIELEIGNENLERKVVYNHNSIIKYRIQYILNDSTTEPAIHNNPISYAPGTEVQLKPAVRPGYRFVGWYEDEALAKEVDGIEAGVTGNVKYYAKWENSKAEDAENASFYNDCSSHNDGLYRMATWANGGVFDCVFSSDNIRFQNGIMYMKIDENKNHRYDYEYSGAEYRTENHYGYGMYTVRMKPIKNDGVVSSFFTYTGPSEGNIHDEIDIEFLGKDTTKVQFNFFANGESGHECLYDLGFDASKEWHEYGFLWEKDAITWYVDGKAVYKVTSEECDLPYTVGRVMMNVWNGDTSQYNISQWLNDYDGTIPLTAEYDYFSYTTLNDYYDGMVKISDTEIYYYIDGEMVADYTGLVKDDGTFWYVKNGKFDGTYTGLAKNKYGWWYIKEGKLDRTYTGLAKNKYGWWYVRDGKVRMEYINNGKSDSGYTGLAKNEYGWWYVKNGKLDRTYTGLAKNRYGWWYVKNGKLDRTYTGLAKNKYGWWYTKNGKVDRTYTGLAKNKYGWWYAKNGKLDRTHTGLAMNEYGWWYVKNGKLDRTYTGLAKNEYGWWYVRKGKVRLTYLNKIL